MRPYNTATGEPGNKQHINSVGFMHEAFHSVKAPPGCRVGYECSQHEPYLLGEHAPLQHGDGRAGLQVGTKTITPNNRLLRIPTKVYVWWLHPGMPALIHKPKLSKRWLPRGGAVRCKLDPGFQPNEDKLAFNLNPKFLSLRHYNTGCCEKCLRLEGARSHCASMGCPICKKKVLKLQSAKIAKC